MPAHQWVVASTALLAVGGAAFAIEAALNRRRRRRADADEATRSGARAYEPRVVLEGGGAYELRVEHMSRYDDAGRAFVLEGYKGVIRAEGKEPREDEVRFVCDGLDELLRPNQTVADLQLLIAPHLPLLLGGLHGGGGGGSWGLRTENWGSTY